jgi:hypothetical protein
MKKNLNPESAASSKVAFFWDESFLWGLMSYKALRANGLSFDLVRCREIRRGILKNYSMLFVPGGWASNKLMALGDDGASEIRRFVESGGSYLGFCGGAGLATLDGIGLLQVKRKPTKERVPSFSGRILLNLKEHPIWKCLSETVHRRQAAVSSAVFQAWWPSQLLIEDKSIKVLATYDEALPDSFSSDLNVGDTAANGNWDELEKVYGINLNPERLHDDPAVVEGVCGRGRVILSLVHFDTPSDDNGSVVLKNLWDYLTGRKTRPRECRLHPAGAISDSVSSADEVGTEVSELEARVEDLICLGMRNFLWFWRNPMLLQWRRGVRGLEYCTLYIMIKEISEIMRLEKYHLICGDECLNRLKERLSALGSLLIPFIDESKRLLVLERLAMQNGHITYQRCEDPEVGKIRRELFSNSKSHGGLFKQLINEIDKVLFMLIDRSDM